MRAGGPFVFVSGNHDSDTLSRSLARRGAIVLTERGRLLPGRRLRRTVVRAAASGVAGYSDPFERRRADGYRAVARAERDGAPSSGAFWHWLQTAGGPRGRGDGALPGARALALEELRASPPAAPLVLLTGHTHEQALTESERRRRPERRHRRRRRSRQLPREPAYGLAILTYEPRPSFEPLAADLVRIDAPDGSANAERRAAGRGAAHRSERRPSLEDGDHVLGGKPRHPVRALRGRRADVRQRATTFSSAEQLGGTAGSCS